MPDPCRRASVWLHRGGKAGLRRAQHRRGADPSEERIKPNSKACGATYLPMHSVLRIDEVEKEGVSKISKAEGGNVAQFPCPYSRRVPQRWRVTCRFGPAALTIMLEIAGRRPSDFRLESAAELRRLRPRGSRPSRPASFTMSIRQRDLDGRERRRSTETCATVRPARRAWPAGGALGRAPASARSRRGPARPPTSRASAALPPCAASSAASPIASLAKAPLRPAEIGAIAPLLHDRMTETVLPRPVAAATSSAGTPRPPAARAAHVRRARRARGGQPGAGPRAVRRRDRLSGRRASANRARIRRTPN